MRKVVLLLALFAVPAWSQIPLPPAPQKFVTDAADVIPDEREHALNERLAEFERTSTHQIIVYVDRNIPEGTTLEEMSAEAIRTWGVGQVKRDNGAILFLFIDSRDSRIEVGYGLEGTLTDAKSKRILVEMRPLLRNGEYAGAVEKGAEAIIGTIAPEPPAPVAAPRRQRVQQPLGQPVDRRADPELFAAIGSMICGGPLLILLFVFLLIVLIRRGAFNLPHHAWRLATTTAE
jgi:uncharacterized membrane protein YgcG